MANFNNYLIECKIFLENFANTVDPDDQLPVKVGSYCLYESEVLGEIVDWTLQYLNQKRCPSALTSSIVRIVIDEVNKACKEDPVACGFREQDKVYQPLKLMQVVTSKVNEVCLRYRENGNIETLPPPTSGPPISTCAIKNGRRMMEDRHVIIEDFNKVFDVKDSNPASFYAVFDGHAGSDAAVYSVSHLHQFLAESKHYSDDPVGALKEAIFRTDALFIDKSNKENLRSGTTVVCALLRPVDKMLYVAWLGDSQALLVRKGQPVKIVNPHKPDRKDERERIEDMGGMVMYWGTWRVNGQLAVSRAIGDSDYKPFVTAEPDVTSVPLDGTEDFLILACDGLWDFVKDHQAVQTVYNQLHENPEDLEAVSERLVQLSKSQGSSDNISVIVVFLRSPSLLAYEQPIRMDSVLESRDFLLGNDLGPETDVDGLDEELQRQQMSEFDPVREPRQEIPTPPADQVPGIGGADSGEDSEDEWNYYRGVEEPTGKSPDSQKQKISELLITSEDQSSDQSDMESRLNPNAAEFIPSPSLSDDVILAQSPQKAISMDNVVVPSEVEFDSEASKRPGEVTGSALHDDVSAVGKLSDITEGESLNRDIFALDTSEQIDALCREVQSGLEFGDFSGPQMSFKVSGTNLHDLSDISTKADFGDEPGDVGFTESLNNSSAIDNPFLQKNTTVQESFVPDSLNFSNVSAHDNFVQFENELLTESVNSSSNQLISFEVHQETVPQMVHEPERVKVEDESPFRLDQTIEEVPTELTPSPSIEKKAFVPFSESDANIAAVQESTITSDIKFDCLNDDNMINLDKTEAAAFDLISEPIQDSNSLQKDLYQNEFQNLTGTSNNPFLEESVKEDNLPSEVQQLNEQNALCSANLINKPDDGQHLYAGVSETIEDFNIKTDNSSEVEALSKNSKKFEELLYSEEEQSNIPSQNGEEGDSDEKEIVSPSYEQLINEAEVVEGKESIGKSTQQELVISDSFVTEFDKLRIDTDLTEVNNMPEGVDKTSHGVSEDHKDIPTALTEVATAVLSPVTPNASDALEEIIEQNLSVDETSVQDIESPDKETVTAAAAVAATVATAVATGSMLASAGDNQEQKLASKKEPETTKKTVKQSAKAPVKTKTSTSSKPLKSPSPVKPTSFPPVAKTSTPKRPSSTTITAKPSKMSPTTQTAPATTKAAANQGKAPLPAQSKQPKPRVPVAPISKPTFEKKLPITNGDVSKPSAKRIETVGTRRPGTVTSRPPSRPTSAPVGKTVTAQVTSNKLTTRAVPPTKSTSLTTTIQKPKIPAVNGTAAKPKTAPTSATTKVSAPSTKIIEKQIKDTANKQISSARPLTKSNLTVRSTTTTRKTETKATNGKITSTRTTTVTKTTGAKPIKKPMPSTIKKSPIQDKDLIKTEIVNEVISVEVKHDQTLINDIPKTEGEV